MQCEFTGNLIYMSEGVEMETSTGGGAGKMFSRVLTGQNLMVCASFCINFLVLLFSVLELLSKYE